MYVQECYFIIYVPTYYFKFTGLNSQFLKSSDMYSDKPVFGSNYKN